MFAESLEGIQTLLDVVQVFTTRCGMEINIKKTFLLSIDQDLKRRESMLAPDLRINYERVKTLDIYDACQYLNYWSTGKVDMGTTREVINANAKVACDLIKSHSLTPELSAELFAQKGVSAFWFMAALIEWLQSALGGLQKIYVKAYKNAWRVPWTMIKCKLPVYLPNCRGWT